MPVATQRGPHAYSYADYLGLEEDSNVRHEFLSGEIYAMAGGSPEHAMICASVIADLGGQLRGKHCRVATSDLRVRVLDTGLATYPDVTVICGPVALDPADTKRQTVTNPTVLIEVTSKSTEDFDRGEKFENYRRISTLREYVLVSQVARSVEVHRRDPNDSWTAEIIGPGGRARLESLGVDLDVDSIFDAALGTGKP
jgi:Uma2 family endonuclease